MNNRVEERFNVQNPPSSLSKANERRGKLITEIKNIDLQLADRNKQNPENEKRMDSHDYEEWRRKALSAKFGKEKEICFLKNWIKDQRAILFVSVVEAEVDNPHSLIQAAYKLLRSIEKQGYDFAVEDIALLDMLKTYLLESKIPTNSK